MQCMVVCVCVWLCVLSNNKTQCLWSEVRGVLVCVKTEVWTFAHVHQCHITYYSCQSVMIIIIIIILAMIVRSKRINHVAHFLFENQKDSGLVSRPPPFLPSAPSQSLYRPTLSGIFLATCEIMVIGYWSASCNCILHFRSLDQSKNNKREKVWAAEHYKTLHISTPLSQWSLQQWDSSFWFGPWPAVWWCEVGCWGGGGGNHCQSVQQWQASFCRDDK